MRRISERTRERVMHDLYQNMVQKRMVYTRTCQQCGRVMEGVAHDRRYCSLACKAKWRRALERAHVQALEAQVAATREATEVSNDG